MFGAQMVRNPSTVQQVQLYIAYAMQVEVTAAGDDNTDQAKVAQELLKLKKKKSDLKVVQGRGVQLGDSAVVDFDARQSDTGEEFQGAKRRKTTLDTDSADMQFLPGQY